MPRILLLGMGDAAHGDDGIGLQLTRAIGEVIDEVEAKEAPSNEMDVLELIRDFDLVFVIDSVCVPGEPGRVLRVSPMSLLSLKVHPGPQEEAFDHALEAARIYGRALPVIEVIGVCVADAEASSLELSAEMKAMYKSVLARVRAIIVSMVRDARFPRTPTEAAGG